ncbi:hypothetical protein ACP4OV_001016 [Aristida adscensionis]
MSSEEKGRPLPKFGEWDVNNPASADGFTVIFSKARDEKKAPNQGHNVNRSADSKDSRTEKISSYNSTRTNASGKEMVLLRLAQSHTILRKLKVPCDAEEYNVEAW